MVPARGQGLWTWSFLMIEVITADITTLSVDAIVNAANERMLGGGGVDGAIHAAAGPDLLASCRRVAEARPGVRCPTGEARITTGFELPARFVIHTVGPRWRGGGHGEQGLLRSCYQNCLALAVGNGLRSIAFPAISTGVYDYPKGAAAQIAVTEMRAAQRRFKHIVACCFTEADAALYLALL
jgi:O-acetyl-ADP-ribose deacetylase